MRSFRWVILTVEVWSVLIVVDNSLNLLKAAAIYCLNNKNIFVTDLDKTKSPCFTRLLDKV